MSKAELSSPGNQAALGATHEANAGLLVLGSGAPRRTWLAEVQI